jgi:Flp pilus assembly protein TadD
LREVRQDIRAAERVLAEGLGVNAKDEGLLLAYGELLYAEKRYAEAATLFARYAKKRPYNHDALIGQAVARFLSGGPAR